MNKLTQFKRLKSLDALRGLDMIFLVGLAGMFRSLPDISENVVFVWLANQTRHPEWQGFTAYDIIFPLFIFIVGVAIPFSFNKRLARNNRKSDLIKHVFFRS